MNCKHTLLIITEGHSLHTEEGKSVTCTETYTGMCVNMPTDLQRYAEE